MLRWFVPLALVVAMFARADAGVFKPRGKGTTTAKKAPPAKKAPAKAPAKRAVTTKAPAKKKPASRVAEKGRPDDLTPDVQKKGKQRDEVTVVDEGEEEDVIVKDDDD